MRLTSLIGMKWQAHGKSWDKETVEFPNYAAGTMGPECSFDLLEKENRTWVWRPDEWYRHQGQLK